MSEALCQCGHSFTYWHETARGNCNGPSGKCGCPAFTPPPTREPIRLTDEERGVIAKALRGAWRDEYSAESVVDGLCPAVESILAARLAGGPTLAAAWDEGYTTGSTDCARFLGWATSEVPSARPKDRTNPYRTPESEDTE